MSEMFKLSDIKAGYLLRVRDLEGKQDFNMTVVPSSGYKPLGLLGMILAALEPERIVPGDDGDLACCCPADPHHFWPLSQFNEDLNTEIGAFQVREVYGYTPPALLLNNSTEGRECLWVRPDVEVEADETAADTEPKAMTLTEIEAELGHPVRIV